MSKLGKHVWILIAAQVACVAFGLWVHYHFFAASLKRQSESGQQLSADGALASLAGVSAVTVLWSCTLLGIVAYITVSRFHKQLSEQQVQLSRDAIRRTQALVRTRNAVILGLARLADSRDPETGDHLERIGLYCLRLATALGRRPKFRDLVTPAYVSLLELSAPLHDIGKVGLEDAILLKPGRLSEEERDRMQVHVLVGARCLKEVEQRLGTSNFLEMARHIVEGHHECWDGSGYPEGLSGESIPLAARIVAIADVYDAMSTKRVYKEALPHEECVEIIRNEAGKHFDPEVVEVFLEIEGQFREIARRRGVAAEDVAQAVKESPHG